MCNRHNRNNFPGLLAFKDIDIQCATVTIATILPVNRVDRVDRAGRFGRVDRVEWVDRVDCVDRVDSYIFGIILLYVI